MPAEPDDASSDEQILARVLRELERSPRRTTDVEQILRDHPHLQADVRDLEALGQVLDRSRERADQPLPERLGEFRIVRRLETGGMGDVYEAWQEPLHRRVAIKVLRHGLHSAAARERFMREQRVLAQLHQTNIVPIHTAGREGLVEYFAMPFIDGAALRHVVQAAAEFSSERPGTKTPSIADLIGRTRETRIDPAPAASGARRTPPRLPAFRPSHEYLQSVARVMADAAQAVQHAHDKGVRHRDIKPSNIMVEAHATADGSRADQCWVIDFGLASYRGDALAQAAAPPEAARQAEGRDASPVMSGVMGTPAYMAPEQFEGRADDRADVWGLGVTLYELLTLRRAFPAPDEGSDYERFAAVRAHVRDTHPSRPRGLIPRDLEAICFKALRKEPAQRYATAQELADDLRRWLRGEVVAALQEEAPLLAVPIRSARWARRNKGWTAALAGLGAVVLMSFMAVEGRRRAAQHAVDLQGLELARSPPRTEGWSGRARKLADSIAQDDADDHLRDALASTFEGLDAFKLDGREIPASSLAFDEGSDELLLGGVAREGVSAVPARSWRPGAEPQACGLSLPGPVACRPDGTRVQFVHDADAGYRSYDMTRDAPLASCALPGAAAGPLPVLDELGMPVMALSADASVAVAAMADASAGGAGVVAAWDALSGRPIASFPVHATAVAAAADGSYVAAGGADGRVAVWRLPSGERVVEILEPHDIVQSLAFGRHTAGAGADVAASRDFLLAIGCPSGRIEVWDSRDQRLYSGYRGMNHRVLSLAFSPDGSLLAAAGEGAMIWDRVSAERLLVLGGTVVYRVAFSADGQRLALSNDAAFKGPGELRIMQLEPGRGIGTLRGLDRGTFGVTFSADGKQLAALSGDWDLGIWDCEAGAQRLQLDAPRGISADNVGLAFSPDGSRLAFTAGSVACVWGAHTGGLLETYDLSPGLADDLTYDERGELISARCEPRRPRGAELPVCQVRNLSRSIDPIFEMRDFDTLIVGVALDPRGNYVVVEGDRGASPNAGRMIKAFELPSGKLLWQEPSLGTTDGSSLHVDPTGQFLSYQISDRNPILVAMPSGRKLEAVPRLVGLGPAAEVLIREDETGTSLSFRGGGQPFLRLRDTGSALGIADLSGQRIAFGRPDGTVQLLDLADLRVRLGELGLGW